MLDEHVANHMKWQEEEIYQLRMLYEDERKSRYDLEEENEKLKKEIKDLKYRLAFPKCKSPSTI